jgi:hypothetical protein
LPSAVHVALGELDEIRADAVTETARSAVEHEPDLVALVEAHLDEVVAGAERRQLAIAVALRNFGVFFRKDLEPAFEGRPRGLHFGRGTAPRAPVVTPAVVGAAMRYGCLDRASHGLQVVGQVRGRERRFHRHHAAPDVDTDGGGNDRTLGGDDGAHGGADSFMHVGHQRDVPKDERHAREIFDLRHGLGLDGNAVGPGFDGHARDNRGWHRGNMHIRRRICTPTCAPG